MALAHEVILSSAGPVLCRLTTDCRETLVGVLLRSFTVVGSRPENVDENDGFCSAS